MSPPMREIDLVMAQRRLQHASVAPTLMSFPSVDEHVIPGIKASISATSLLSKTLQEFLSATVSYRDHVQSYNNRKGSFERMALEVSELREVYEQSTREFAQKPTTKGLGELTGSTHRYEERLAVLRREQDVLTREAVTLEDQRLRVFTQWQAYETVHMAMQQALTPLTLTDDAGHNGDMTKGETDGTV